VSVEYVVHDGEIHFLLHLRCVFPVENDLVEPVHFRYQGLWVVIGKVLMIKLENSLKKFEFRPRNGLEDELPIACVVKEGT
jgi:hypothetical protein